MSSDSLHRDTAIVALVGCVMVAMPASLIGCDRTNPVAPTSVASATLAVPAFLNDLLGRMQRYSVNSHNVDWVRLRDELTATAGISMSTLQSISTTI